MVEFITRTFNEDDGKIIGAEVTVYSDSGDKIGVIDVADAEKLQELEQQLALIDETYFTEERLATILANINETEAINATSLSGFQSSDFAKVSQLSAYAPVSHNHTKNQVTDLYNYQISASSYNVDIDSDVNITVKVTNQAGNPVVGVTVPVLKNNESWKSGTTGVNGTFSLSYTADSWGLTTFSAKTQNCQIFVDGWKQVSNIRINGNHRLAEYHSEYLKSTASEIALATIPSGYSPMIPIIRPAHVTADIKFVINSNGSIRLIGTGTGTANINALWRY